MNLDIPLAAWLLSVVTFVLGTITPFLYRRFFYEGFSVKQVHDIRAITQNENEKSLDELVFSTIVKLANAQKGTVLLDSVEVPSLNSGGIYFDPIGFDLKIYEPKAQIHLPPNTDPDGTLDYLPLLVKPDQERIIAIGIRFHHNSKDDTDAVLKLSDYIENQGLKVAFRINGKYRNYVMKVKRPD